jgi:hypothetical protein
MKFQELAIEVKTLNILDMALSFSAMARVFSNGVETSNFGPAE